MIIEFHRTNLGNECESQCQLIVTTFNPLNINTFHVILMYRLLYTKLQ